MTTRPAGAPAGTDLAPDRLAAVAAYLRAEGVPVTGELRARLIAGGRSNLTYELRDAVRRWVLRRPPTGGLAPSAHDVAREFRVTRALHRAGVPVAPTVAVCEDTSVLGATFTVVEFVDGVSIRSGADLAELDDTSLAAAVDGLVAALAALHGVDHVAAGLGDFGRAEAYAERQLRRWTTQWGHVAGHHDEGVRRLADEVAARLGRDVPAQSAVAVVHGDYRIDNTLLATDGTTGRVTGRVAAIVDWELSTIGDPVADVALMAVYRHPALDLILGFDAAWTSPRLPDGDALAAAYEAAGGARLVAWDYHRALAAYKLAVIAAGIDHRYREGVTVGDGFDTAAEAVAPLLEEALRAVR